MRHYVAAWALGSTRTHPDEVILSAYGPRGGAVALFGMTPEEARDLRDRLSVVLLAIATEGIEP